MSKHGTLIDNTLHPAPRAIRIGACNLYHGCVHNMLYGKSDRALAGLYKSAAFILQAVHFRRSGSYIRHLDALIPLLPQKDRAILQTAQALKRGAPVNIAKHIEAINTAIRALGGKATMAEIWRWAKNDKNSDNDTP